MIHQSQIWLYFTAGCLYPFVIWLFNFANTTKSEGSQHKVAMNVNDHDNGDFNRWHKYSCCYQEQGPLMINVVGLTDEDRNGK